MGEVSIFELTSGANSFLLTIKFTCEMSSEQAVFPARYSFFSPRADTKNPIYSYWKKNKKNIELLTNKAYQETIGFLALLRVEQGFPFQRKLKSMKGKKGETIWAHSGQAERRRRETTREVRGHAPEKFWKFQCSETQSGAFLLSWLSIPNCHFCVCFIEIFRIPYIFQVNIQYF